ncbi:MAG: CBS domain-containing protein [Deltaproteobacteria bacterium]|nr:CBS domain-containing protein [Deltaproteobacteria bacterium]
MEFTASSIMRSKLVVCNDTESLKAVAKKMFDEKVGSVLIKQKEEVIGIIIDRDILKAIVDGIDFTTAPATEIMSSPLDCCSADDSLEHCNELFEKTHHSRLVVKKEEKVVGVLLRKFVERFLSLSKRYSLADIAQTPRFRTGRD